MPQVRGESLGVGRRWGTRCSGPATRSAARGRRTAVPAPARALWSRLKITVTPSSKCLATSDGLDPGGVGHVLAGGEGCRCLGLVVRHVSTLGLSGS